MEYNKLADIWVHLPQLLILFLIFYNLAVRGTHDGDFAIATSTI